MHAQYKVVIITYYSLYEPILKERRYTSPPCKMLVLENRFNRSNDTTGMLQVYVNSMLAANGTLRFVFYPKRCAHLRPGLHAVPLSTPMDGGRTNVAIDAKT